MTNVLIIASNPQTAALYRMAAEKLGAKCEVALNIKEMKQQIRRTPFNGLLLDVLTAVRASFSDKIDIQNIAEVYPTLRVRWDASAGEIRGLVIGNSIDKEAPLRDFLNKFCHARPARICRMHKRYPLNFNVLLSKDRNFSEELAEKTVTLDISLGGCFVYSTQCWQDTEFAWLRFLEISDANPVQVAIRRFCPWGKTMNIPGIGVEFTQIKPGQREDICRHFKS